MNIWNRSASPIWPEWSVATQVKLFHQMQFSCSAAARGGYFPKCLLLISPGKKSRLWRECGVTCQSKPTETWWVSHCRGSGDQLAVHWNSSDIGTWLTVDSLSFPPEVETRTHTHHHYCRSYSFSYLKKKLLPLFLGVNSHVFLLLLSCKWLFSTHRNPAKVLLLWVLVSELSNHILLLHLVMNYMWLFSAFCTYLFHVNKKPGFLNQGRG